MTADPTTVAGQVRTWATIMRTCGCSPQARLDPIARLLLITRACVQPMTLTAAAIAGALAVRSETFNAWWFALAALGIVVAHAANNMINDYFDLRAGLDTEEYPRSQYAPHPVVSGVVDERGLLLAILVANALDAAIMLVLFAARGWPVVAFALAGLFISVAYVAPPFRLKARGLGEPSVFLIWGPLMVGGTYYAATGSLPTEILFASIPYALLVTTVLMGKHIDKLVWDERAGVATLPALMGEGAARRATAALMVGFYLVAAALVATGTISLWTLVVVLGLPVLRRALRTYDRSRPAEPPERYPLWPLWYGPWAFLHARRAGALLVLGSILGAIWPLWV